MCKALSRARIVVCPQSPDPQDNFAPLSKNRNTDLALDKEVLASRFGARADSYEAATPVQDVMGQYLLDTIRRYTANRSIHEILEVGCGTGRLTRAIKALFPAARITAIDISQEMIHHARQQVAGPEYRVMDAEAYLQSPDRTFDLVLSNATVQWFVDLESGMQRMAAALSPGGLLALGTLGERTFQELADAFRCAYRNNQLTAHNHVVPMKSANCLRRILPEAEVVERDVVSHFTDVRAFLQSIRDAGAVNSQAGHKSIPKAVFRDMSHYYKARYTAPDSSRIQATYHTCFVFYRRPYG